MGDRSSAADVDYLVRRNMYTGYQYTSIVAPPAYTLMVIYRRGWSAFSINRFLRATWLAGVCGSLAYGSYTYARYGNADQQFVKTQWRNVVYDRNRLRKDDFATMGSILMGVLTPALLWRKAHIANLVLGGAGLGSGFGVMVHYTKPGAWSQMPI